MYRFGIGNEGFAKDFLSRELSELSRREFNSLIIFSCYIIFRFIGTELLSVEDFY